MKTNNSPLIGGLFLFPKRITATGTRVAEEKAYPKLLHIELQQQVRESLRFFAANLLFRIGKNRVDFLSAHGIIKTLGAVAFYCCCFSAP